MNLNPPATHFFASALNFLSGCHLHASLLDSEGQDFIPLWEWTRGGGFLVQRSIRGNGSQNQPLGITMTPYLVQKLVKTWVIFSKFSKIGAKMGPNSSIWYQNFLEILTIWGGEGSMKFLVSFTSNLWLWYKNGSHFSAKFGIKMGLLCKSQQHVPTQIILE